MEKRILSLLVAMAMILAFIVMPAENHAAATQEESLIPEICPCGCELPLDQVEWWVWDPNNTSVNPSGHYYLDGHYVQDEQFGISTEKRIVLDLRGYELSTKEYGRLFLCNGFLAVMDTVGGGRMSAKTAGNGFGGLLLMQTSGSCFELYGGTVTVDDDNKGSRRGGLISVGTGCTFNMYGGMLLGGSSQGTQNEEGGCVASYYSSGVIRILGGSVVGGYSPTHGGNIYSKGTTILKNCTITGGVAGSYGGNIYQSGGSLTIENCEISHGVSNGTTSTVTGGGNVCAVSSAQVTMKDTKLHNGYAAGNGGNAYFGSGTQNLENVTLTAGVSRQKGGNLQIAANSTTTMTDCTADGDVNCLGSLTLAGATKLALRNYGLGLQGTVNAQALTQGAEIYVSGEGIITGGKAEFFKPAIRTVLTETEDGITATLAADGEIAGYCPHCGEQVAWTGYTNSKFSADGHYYLTATQSSYGQKSIANDVVLDLNGYSLTGTSRAFFINSGGVTLLDTVGGSTVTMTGAEAGHGGLIRNDGGNLQIFGGTYVLKAGKTVRYGGILYTSGQTKIAGGVFDASAYVNEADYGANLYHVGGKHTLNISAGYFAGGRAASGGNLYLTYNISANITGGHFAGGSAATTGGNINVVGTSKNKTGSLNISNAAMTAGQADTSAGNINITYYETVRVADSYIAKGTTLDYGGNILVSANSTFAVYENCAIYGGSAKRGGNIYSSGTGGRVRFIDCTIMDGVSSGNGGNVQVNNGYVEILGGSVTYGTAAAQGGNIYTGAGANNSDATANYFRLQKSEKGSVPLVINGTAKEGGNIYFTGAFYLTDALIRGGRVTEEGADLYMAKSSLQNMFTVGEGATGKAQIYVNSGLLGSPVYGQPITGGAATELNMHLTLEGSYGMPQICAEDGKLLVAGAALVKGDVSTPYGTASAAAEDWQEGTYVQLFADTQLILTQDCVVDLNGYTATVTGDYTLYGMDSSADDLEGSGKAVWAEETSMKTAEVCYAPNGKIYVAIAQGAEVTYHYLNMRINGAAIRPSVSGMYYTGLWECDAALQAKLNTYGVAVDTVNLPDKDFMSTGTALWTVMDAEALVNGETKTGAIISNIMSADRMAELNDAYGKMPIFAAAYVTLDSGTTVTGGAVGYSLYSAMQQLESCLILDPATYGKHIYPAGKFYRQWKDMGMGSWEFARIDIDPYCPWNYNVVEQAVREGKMHYYFMSGEWHAYSGGSTEPEKWGDSCLIVFPDGQTMLIDSGVTQYGPILVENLRRMGVTKLDHLVITHPHSDHQNGIFSTKNRAAGGVLDTFPIGQVYHRGGYDSKNMESSQLVATVCAERNLPLQTLDIGDSFQIGEVSVRVLWPQEGTADKDITGVNAAATNDTSVVLRFDYKEHSSLFTGDIYVESEARVMAANDAALLDADLLKLPHHGNTVTSNSEEFLAAVSPKIAVATGFEIMDARSLSRFTAVGATVLNDRIYGYVHVATDGNEMTYETSREASLME